MMTPLSTDLHTKLRPPVPKAFKRIECGSNHNRRRLHTKSRRKKSYPLEILARKTAELTAEVEALSASEWAAKERVFALEQELSLLKNGSADRISELEAALVEARAAHLEVSKDRDALWRDLRQLKRRVEDLEAEIAMLKAGHHAIVPRVAKHIKPPFVPTAKTLRLLVGHILAEKAAADVHDDQTPGDERQSLDHFVYDYFLLRFGIRQLAESHISALVRGIATHWERGGGGRLGTFGALLGCLPASAIRGVRDGNGDRDGNRDGDGDVDAFVGSIANDEAALGFYLHVRCAMFSRSGGVPATELEEGVAEVPTGTVREVVTAALAPVMSAADVVTRMAAVGGGADDDDLIDLDKALAAALVVWSGAREAAGDRVAKLFHEHDENSDGVMTWAEFSAFIESCQPGLSTRQKKELFREAINGASGTAENAAATPATVRTVAMNHGLGFLPVRLPLDPLVPRGAPPPPIDEFGLLQEAWAAAEERTKTALDEKKAGELARSAARRGGGDAGAVAADAAAAAAAVDAAAADDVDAGDHAELCAMVEQFQELVGAASPGTETAAWQLIRRVFLAVHLWEEEVEMRAREENAKKLGVASYGSSQARAGGDSIYDRD